MPPRPPESLPATAVLALVTLGAAAGFERIFADQRWILPVVTVAVAVHVVSWMARHFQLSLRWGLAVGTVTIGVVSTWTVVGGSTFAGIPTPGTILMMHAALVSAQRALPMVVAPAPDLVGFRLVAAWSAGLVALVGDWAAFRTRSSLQALCPAFALFIICCAVGVRAGRLWAVTALVASMILFLLIHRDTVGRAGTVWFADRYGGGRGWTVGIGAGLTALVGAALVVPALPPSEGGAIFGWQHGISGAAQARSVISPIVDLRTRIVSETNTPVMTVTSAVSSYWRLTSLDTFTGVQWQSTDSYQGIGDRLPGIGAPPAGTRQVTEQFHVQTLDSIWLPAAFFPESVRGGGHVTYDPVSGSLLTDRATADGLSYTVTSLQYLDNLNTRVLENSGPLPTDGALAHDLALPVLPPAIRQLAQRITAGKTTEFDKALALQNFFYGNQFTYSLDPPVDGYGTDALATFLFSTRTGYCQQFAGAYAVLARSIGLPTRLAVGFTPGAQVSPGHFLVTDADAHTWPEVYFAGHGWLPFEPTKGGGFAIPGATGYTGATASPTSAEPVQAAPVAPAQPTLSDPATPKEIPHRPAHSAPVPIPSRPHHVWVGFVVAPIAAGGVGIWLAGITGVRRLRWRRRRRRAAAQGETAPAQVMAIWAETEELLAWWGLRRRVEETYLEVAVRAGGQLREMMPEAPADLDALAGWAAEADFAAVLAPGTVARADAARNHVGTELRQAAHLGLRLRWLSDPRLAWRRRF